MANTTTERLARMEAKQDIHIERIDKLHERLDETSKELAADKAELAALKNKGTGILIGVGLLAAFLGAKMQSVFQMLGGIFK